MTLRLHIFPDITKALSSGYLNTTKFNAVWWPGEMVPKSHSDFREIVFWGTRTEYERVHNTDAAIEGFLVNAVLNGLRPKFRNW
ncbi:hypothetical protein [Asticcacaulis benevestitus]|uniref:hypothetical protein n=1 Tax=Asticcacaulis benevestitus TaxID=347481 RepID=UPI000AA259A6|nr:hypothetical protein [Asticcacaulis benevestitus]